MSNTLSAAQRLQLAHEQANATSSDSSRVNVDSSSVLTEDPFPVHPPHHATIDTDPFPVAASASNGAAATAGDKRQKKSVDISDQEAFPSLGGGPGAGPSSSQPARGGWGAGGGAALKAKAAAAAPAAGQQLSTTSSADLATLNFLIPTSAIHISSPGGASDRQQQNGGGMMFSNDPRYKAGPPTTLGQVLKLVEATPKNRAARVSIEASSSSKLTTFIVKAAATKATSTTGAVSARDQVERVQAELLSWLEKKVKDQVQVPKSLRAIIIGAKGRNLKAIIDSTGCSIQIPRDDELEQAGENDDQEDEELGPMISISLSGASSSVQSAKQQILSIVRERTSKTTTTVSDVPSELFVFLRSSDKMREIIRRAIVGANEELEQEAIDKEMENVNVFVPRRSPPGGKRGVDVEEGAGDEDALEGSDEAKGSNAAIRVTGDKDLVKKVVQAIHDEVNELRSTIRPVIFSLPKRQHRFLVGSAISDRILEQTGCAVEVPAQENESEDVTVRGPSRETIKAMQLVMDLASVTPVEQLDLLTAHRGTHDPKVYARSLSRYLLLKQKLRAIAQETGTKIYLPKPSSITGASKNAYLEIVGNASATAADASAASGQEGVSKARGQVITEVRKLPPSAFEVVEIDELVHRYLIGKRGVKVKGLEKEHDVEIVFPREGEGREVLVVYVGQDVSLAKSALDATRQSLDALVAEYADLVTLTLSIPSNLHGAVIGTGGTTLNAVLGEEKLAHVQFNAGEDEVVVRGPADEAERVRRELEQIAELARNEEIVNSHIVEFEIETALVRHVVGKAGSGVNKLREELGVRVDFVELATTNKKGAKLSKVTIKGRKENVEEAAKRVKGTATKMADEVTLTIPLPAALDRGSLIGKQGTYLKRLEDKYDVRINFPKSKSSANDSASGDAEASSSSEIVIRGPSKGAQSAKGELVDLISYEKEHGNTVSFTVPVKALPRILGRGGSQVNQIKDDTGVASVDIDQESNESEEATISLKGTKASIKSARAEIEKIAKEVSDEARIELDIPKEYHTTLIGSGGSSIRDLITRCGGPSDGRASGNMVRFPRQGDSSNTVTIIAPSSIAHKIKAELDKEIELLASRVVWGVVVPQSNHAAVIGKGAQALQETQRKHGVRIYMPGWNDYASAGAVENAEDGDVSQAEEKDVVKVVGPKDAVLAAATELQAVKGRGGSGTATPNGTSNGASSSAQHSVKVDVPRRHHAVIAQGGRFFRSLPNGTRVSHEGIKPPSSTIKAKRPPVATNGAAAARIDDAGDYDSSATTSEGIEFQLAALYEGDDEARDEDGDDTIPWVVESKNEDDAQKVADEIRKSLVRAKEATHVGWVTVPRGMMPRIVGRGGSGLDRLRATGVDVEVVGKRDANQLTLTGSPAAIEEARSMIEQLNAPRQRRDRDEY